MKNRYFLSLALLFTSSVANAATLEVVNEAYKFDHFPEYEALMSALKSHGEFEEKVISVEKKDEPRKLSRGEQIVEEAKARNRAIIAQQNAQDKKIVGDQSKLSDLDRLKLEDQKIREGWKKEVIEQRKQWQREQEIFLGRLKIYKENTFVVPAPVVKIVEKKLTVDVMLGIEASSKILAEKTIEKMMTDERE